MKERMLVLKEMKDRIEIRNNIMRAKEELNHTMNKLIDDLFKEGTQVFKKWFEELHEVLVKEVNAKKICDSDTLKEYFIENEHCGDIKISIHLHISEFYFKEKAPVSIMSVKFRSLKRAKLHDIDIHFHSESVEEILRRMKIVADIVSDDGDFNIKWFK